MLDSNVFDRLDADREALSELANRRDIRPLISSVQLSELAAIPDPDKRAKLLRIAGELCSTLAAPDPGAAKASHDGLILEAAKSRCRLLVSDDGDLLELAASSGLKAMDYDSFASRVLFRRG